MRPPWRPQRRNQRPKRSEISSLREWRRGESNRPAEDSGGRRSKLYRDLSWGCLPPTTLHYRQLVPEGQPRALASKPEDQAHQLISQHPSSVRTRAVERTATRYPTYGSAAEVKGAFISDLRSEVGQ